MKVTFHLKKDLAGTYVSARVDGKMIAYISPPSVNEDGGYRISIPPEPDPLKTRFQNLEHAKQWIQRYAYMITHPGEYDGTPPTD